MLDVVTRLQGASSFDKDIFVSIGKGGVSVAVTVDSKETSSEVVRKMTEGRNVCFSPVRNFVQCFEPSYAVYQNKV